MKENGSRTDEPRTPPEAVGRPFYRALESRERRRILAILLDGRERTVEEAATLLAGWDATASRAVDPADRKRTLLRLRHVHLPMLADAGLVNYDSGRGTVTIASLDPATVEYLERSLEAAGECPT